MTKGKYRGFLRLGLVTAAAFILALGLMMREVQAPVEENTAVSREETAAPEDAAVSQGSVQIAPGCNVIQTMGFSRCGHSVTRRITVPERLVGADFAKAQADYALWQINSFSSDQISMSREIPLFCPMHTVLTVSEAGEIVLSRNTYGDGMAVIKSCGMEIGAFSEDMQDALRLGIGFDSQADAEAYLRSH